MPIHLPPLSRRGFLKATLAAGAAAVLPGRTGAADPAVDPNRVALLADTPALFKVLAPRRRAKAYIFGHSHAWSYRKEDDVHLANVPATAHLFSKKQPRGWLDARLDAGGVRLALRTVDASDPRDGKSKRLAWRA